MQVLGLNRCDTLSIQAKVTRHSDDFNSTHQRNGSLKSYLTPCVIPPGFQQTTHESFWNSKFPWHWAFASSDGAWQGIGEPGAHSHHFPGWRHRTSDSRRRIALP